MTMDIYPIVNVVNHYRLKIMRNRLNKQNGGVLHEYAITISTIAVVIFSGLNLLVSSYHALTVQFIANRALRMAVIGPPSPTPVGYNHTTAIRDFITSYGRRLGVAIDNEEISICPISNQSCYPSISAGNPNEWIMIRINLNERIFNKFGYNTTAIAVGRNEPT